MKKIITVIIFIIIIIFIARAWWDSQLAPVSSDKTTTSVIISRGKSLSDIAKQLKDQNLIRSQLIFSLYTRQQGLASKLSAGTFKLSPSMSTPEIVRILSGTPTEAWITLIEGWRVEEIADRLSEQGLGDREQFIRSSQEGYMFPDTYLFPNDVTEEQIVKKLRDNFETKYSDEIRAKIKALGLTEGEGVILASIVEREARSDGARRMVASILLKRLKIGMGLNADATVQYALVPRGSENPPESGWWKRNLTKDDLKIDSPFNTYIHSGLPSAPISNPGLASLQAVADADPAVPYLYYYHDSKGNSHYAKTLEEHNQNIVNNP